MESAVRTPGAPVMGDVPRYPASSQGTMIEAVEKMGAKYPNINAYEFMGSYISYPKLVAQIHDCARALRQLGIKEGDKVTICMPNAPQTVVMFYAVNMVGAIANMVAVM